jgi:hypothetical protein
VGVFQKLTLERTAVVPGQVRDIATVSLVDHGRVDVSNVLATQCGLSPAANAHEANVWRVSYMRRYINPLFSITLAHTSLSLS